MGPGRRPPVLLGTPVSRSDETRPALDRWLERLDTGRAMSLSIFQRFEERESVID